MNRIPYPHRTFRGKKRGVPTVPKEVSIADLQDQTSEKMQAFMTDIQMGLMTVMGKAAAALPSFMTLMQQMMPKTETAPQN